MYAEPTAQSSMAPKVARAAGGLAILVGGGHVLAWVGGVMPQVPVSTIIMKTNAGLGLLVAGVALILVATPHAGARRWRGAQICAAFVLLLGLATLSEHIVGWDLGIDQLLATEPAGAAATTSPNRMGPPASLSFILLGTALLLLTRRRGAGRRRALHEPFALAVALLGLLSIIGYLYGVSALYQIARFTGVAWPTALSFVVLAVGVLCVEPANGLMRRVTADDPGGAIVRALLGPDGPVAACAWLGEVGRRASGLVRRADGNGPDDARVHRHVLVAAALCQPARQRISGGTTRERTRDAQPERSVGGHTGEHRRCRDRDGRGRCGDVSQRRSGAADRVDGGRRSRDGRFPTCSPS